MRITVVGGGAGGLVTALLLARAGHEVVVLEQDRLEPAGSVEQAADTAFRPTAPQIVQPHAVMARGRELLRDRLPDVYEGLLAAGVVEVPITDWMPDTVTDRSPRAHDDRLRPMLTRRSTFDWVLQRSVLDEPRVTVRPMTRVLGLLARTGEPPLVVGVHTDHGDIASDLVIDATGRRSPIDRWLGDVEASPARTWSAESGVAYFSRHYRIRTGTQLPGLPTSRIVAGLDEFTLAVFGADNATMQIAVIPLAGDHRFRQIKEPDVFSAVLRTIPVCAAWLGVLDPISPIFPMGGPRNTLRRLVVEGRPVVGGLHLVGDSVCTTNPTFGRGLTLAILGALDLLDAITQHPEDLLQQAIAIDAGIARHIVPYYDEQVAVDSSRLATLRHAILGEPRPDMSAPDPERITFTQLRAAASYDSDIFRAFWKLMFMLSQPDDIYRDPDLVASTRDVLTARGLDLLQPRGHLDPLVESPTRDRLLAALRVETVHQPSRPDDSKALPPSRVFS